MSKFKVGDIVETKYGTGKIEEYNEYDNDYLIYRFCWNKGHNGGYFDKYKGNHCWWLDEDELKPAELITSNLITNTIKSTYEPTPIRKQIKISIMPERYVINKGATVLFWGDGTKTIVKRSENDEYNKRLGFLTAYFQKTSGMSKTKANKYLDSLVEQEVKGKKSDWSPKLKIKVSDEELEKLDKIISTMKTKYKVGDKVKVINAGSLYTGYASWFEENNCKELAKYFDLKRYPDTAKICKIVAIGKHVWDNKHIIFAIRPLYSKKIYLIGEEGVEKV